MRALIAGLVLTGSLTSYAGAARADTPACEGKTATIVGTAGSTLTGTDGDDVIVTNGAYLVDTGDGRDTVCATPGSSNGTVQVDASGNDDKYVDTTAVANASVDLDAGDHDGSRTSSDTVVGGPGADRVDAADGGVDHVSTGGGDDLVSVDDPTYASVPSRPSRDVVDLGAGDDLTALDGDDSGAVIDGGPGEDALTYDGGSEHGARPDWTLDNTSGQALRDGAPRARWRHVESLDFTIQAHDVALGGGPGDDRIRLRRFASSITGTVSGNLGAGNDRLTVNLGDLRVDGGPGRDRLDLYLPGARDVHLDLSQGTLETTPEIATSRVPRFEDASVAVPAGGASVEVGGTEGPNRLTVSGGGVCRVQVSGRGGRDVISGRGNLSCEASDRAAVETVEGGPGDDLLVGGPGADHLIGGPGDDVMSGMDGADRLLGGPGDDRADGGRGPDVCDAEKEVRCER